MPELPDVETFKSYIDATSMHQRIEKVEVAREDVLGDVSARSLQRCLKSKSFESTRRYGKYLFLTVSDDGCLVLHFGMTGYPKYSKKSDPPQHTRVLFRFEGGAHLAYVCQRLLGTVDWTDNSDRFIQEYELGIDAQSEELDFQRFQKLMKQKKGSLKSALMDQGMIAGLGNVYVDEILFQAKLHPKTSVKDLEESDLQSIFDEMQHVLDTAIRVKAQREKMPESFLVPLRGEENAKCPRCDDALKTTKVSGRTSYYCPSCQSA